MKVVVFSSLFYSLVLSFSHHDIVLPVLRVFRCWKSFTLEKSILIELCLHFVLGMLQTFPLLQKYSSVGIHFFYSITFLFVFWLTSDLSFFPPATWFCTVLFQRHISLAINLKCFKKFVTAASDERRSHWLWGLYSQELHWLKTSKILLFSNKCHVTGAAGVGAFWFKISTHQIVSVLLITNSILAEVCNWFSSVSLDSCTVVMIIILLQIMTRSTFVWHLCKWF